MNNAASKLQTLAEQVFKRDGQLPVVEKGTNEWAVWHSWRKRHGLSTTFMESKPKFTVPTELPPQSLDEALKEGGPASKRLAK